MIIHFAQPLWLAVGLCLCMGTAFFMYRTIRRRRKALQQFASPHLLLELTRNVSTSRRMLKNILLVAALGCLFIALARPQYGNRWIEVKRKGIDILIGVDVSKSMLARDISPNRLERAKLAIRDFVTRLEGDRVGLLPFAGTAFLMCPLTTDYDAFDASLNALDVNTIPKGGTNLGIAINQATKILANEANHKILILVTDGEDLSNDALKAAEQAQKEKMTIYTIGVGTPEGELIPLPGEGKGKFVQDASGSFVTSRLDEKALTRIAEITKGLYVPLGSMGQGFDTIYQQKLVLVPKEEHGQRKRKIPIERFPWPLGCAVFLLVADFLITGRKSSWILRLPFIKTVGRRKKQQAQIMVLLLLLTSLGPATARASKGEELLHDNKIDQAIAFYQEALKKNPADPLLQFNLGDALYKNKNFEQAAAAFNEALKTDDLSLQAKSYYNRGNTQYFLGEAARKTDPEHTIKLWQQALDSFRAALALQPEDTEAEHNRETVQKKLEELEKQQQKQKEQQSKQSEQQNNKDEKKDKDSQEKNNQDNKQDNQGNGQKDQQNDKQQPGNKQNPQKNAQSTPADTNGSKKDTQQGQNESQEKKKSDAAQTQQGHSTPEQQDTEPRADGQQSGQMSQQDMERRQQGKMTEQEAKNLLNSLKGEQGELNFIPRGTGNPDQEDKDW